MKIKFAGALGALMIAGVAQAQVGTNSCSSPQVDAPRQGRHSHSDASADGVVWPPNHKFRPAALPGCAGHQQHERE
jgi:hypothetical protein